MKDLKNASCNQVVNETNLNSELNFIARIIQGFADEKAIRGEIHKHD